MPGNPRDGLAGLTFPLSQKVHPRRSQLGIATDLLVVMHAICGERGNYSAHQDATNRYTA